MPHEPFDRDAEWMRKAIDLARSGQGFVEPNPMVGCILVSSAGDEIGHGYHAKFGGPHAERVALEDAAQRGNGGLLRGCTAYVNLEPCCHYGKTPPCTSALIEASVGRVVIAMLDPFPQVAGQGSHLLRTSGIEVVCGVEEGMARELNAPYLQRVELQLPWIIAKWAMSLDGRIATRSGHSQWISCEQSRRFVHELRARVDGILVGSGTSIADDPMLNAREVELKRTALRIVADSRLRTPLDSRLVQTAESFATLFLAGPEVTATRVREFESRGVEVLISNKTAGSARLKEFLHHLALEREITNLLVEGGSRLMGSLLDDQLVNQAEIFIAPLMIGGDHAISPIGGLGINTVDQAPVWQVLECVRRGPDLHLSCRRREIKEDGSTPELGS